jgi:hypothetical protein
VLLAAGAFGIGMVWSLTVPPLRAPDEPAHLMAVQQVRKEHRLPHVAFDFSAERAGRITTVVDPETLAYASRLVEPGPLRLEPLESTQPPFYYLLAGAISHVVPAEPERVLRISRGVTVLLGSLTVFFLWAGVRELAPGHPFWAFEVAGLAALLPQFSFNISTVSNDAAIHFTFAASFYVWIRSLKSPDYDPWMLRAGALLGLGVLSKLSGLALLPGLVTVMIFRLRCSLPQRTELQRLWREDPAGFRRAVLAGARRGAGRAAGAGGAALLICGWWLLRNWLASGDPFGFQDLVRYARYRIQALNPGDSFRMNWFLELTWQSFWGRFGWMDRTLPLRCYDQAFTATVILCGLSGVALLLSALRRIRVSSPEAGPAGIPPYARQAVLAMAIVTATLVFLFVRYSREVAFSPQGRYFFPVLLPLGLVFTGGLYFLSSTRVPRILGVASLLLWMLYLNVEGLFQA